MIYHLPLQLSAERQSASHIRPVKMKEAFEKIGYEVELISGYGKERKRKIKEIKQKIKKGVKYEFLYSESSTMPTLLTEKNHIPFYPFLDYDFFSYCKRKNIRIGLFYRDIYWCFKDYYTCFNRYIAKLFYLYDLQRYNKLVNVLFVPSVEMAYFLPIKMTPKLYSLPSGLDLNQLSVENCNNKQSDKIFKILFVGGIGHGYDIRMMMKAVGEVDNFHFTICCRENEWLANKDYFADYLNPNVEIIHKSGEELDMLYGNSDLFCLFIKPDVYRTFAVPYKLFEAIGHSCPIIASEGTWVANYCKNEKIGIACQYDYDSLIGLLKSMTKEKLFMIRQRCAKIAKDNTWEHRCHEVESELLI